MTSTRVEPDLVRTQADKLTASMAGLRCLVTGATSGIGKATAAEFARRGASVAMVARSSERGRPVLEEIIHSTGNHDVHLFVADLSLQKDVRALSDGVASYFDGLAILVNAAAVFVRKRVVTEEGLELMFATNQLAPFVLSLLLLPALRRASPSRIINVTAPSTVRPDFQDLQEERRFRAARAFGASKAANLLFTFALARRLSGSGVTVNAYHPGIVRTNLMRGAALPLRMVSGAMNLLRGKEPGQAAEEIAELALSPVFENTSGKLIHDGKPMRGPFEDDYEAQEELFRACEELAGIHFAAG